MFISEINQLVLPASAVQENTLAMIVIDPGHGGEDGGAVSASGCKESDLNLQIGNRLNDLFCFIGVKTVMTRNEDVSIHDDTAVTISEKKVSDLKNRAKLTNEIPQAMLISIHQNMFSDGKYSGAQVFYAKTDGSETLAKNLQTLLCEKVDPSNHREAKPVNAVWLMDHINCTGVLVECGFLSNAEEELLLKTPEYQKKLSCVLVCGISEYLSEELEYHEI